MSEKDFIGFHMHEVVQEEKLQLQTSPLILISTILNAS